MGSAPIQASNGWRITRVDCGSALGLILIEPRLDARLEYERCLPEQAIGLLTYSCLLPT